MVSESHAAHDPRFGPDPDALFPLPEQPRVVFIKNLDLPPTVEIGALHHLRIGRFCALGAGTRFLMNGGNHRVSGPSTYPFVVFGGAWAGRLAEETAFPTRGDTTIGNDVWTGWDSTILPGVTVGDGTIVGARAVVTRDVPPYAVVAGNPARVVRMRFEPDVVTRLLRVRWSEWDAEKITRHVPAISGGDVNALEAAT